MVVVVTLPAAVTVVVVVAPATVAVVTVEVAVATALPPAEGAPTVLVDKEVADAVSVIAADDVTVLVAVAED